MDKMDDRSFIEIDENWSIIPDSNCFVLRQYYTTEGGEEDHNNWFYRTIEQCLKSLRDKKAKESETVDELLKALEESYALEREQLEDVIEERQNRHQKYVVPNDSPHYLGVDESAI